MFQWHNNYFGEFCMHHSKTSNTFVCRFKPIWNFSPSQSGIMTFGLDSAPCLRACLHSCRFPYGCACVQNANNSSCIMYGCEMIILGYELVVQQVIYGVLFVHSKYIFSGVQSNPDGWLSVPCCLSSSLHQRSLCLSLLEPTSSQKTIFHVRLEQ